MKLGEAGPFKFGHAFVGYWLSLSLSLGGPLELLASLKMLSCWSAAWRTDKQSPAKLGEAGPFKFGYHLCWLSLSFGRLFELLA